jgi:N-acetylglucosamine-6-phosphate deacetylase
MHQAERCILHGMQILVEKNWLANHAVVIENKIIHSIIPQEMIKNHLPAQCYQFAAEDYLIPGLIDLHIHGCGGKDVMDASQEAMTHMSQLLAKEGVTGFLATTMTSSKEKIETALQCIASAMHQDIGAAVLGAHLEGPFLSQAKAGAQSLDDLQLPNIKLLTQWQHLSQGAIKLVTLAPELPDALPFIKALNTMSIVTSVGHTNATYEEIQAAIRAGCSYATHLFNAMSGLHHRAPGAVCALLLSPNIMAELIVDGLHVHPAVVELAFKIKSSQHLVLVTDAMRAKCLGDGQYELGGQSVTVSGGRATLANGTLAGSTLSMLAAIKNMMHFSFCTLAEAIQLATYNPANVLQLSTRKGKIRLGYDADLVVMDPQFTVKLTMREGREIYKTRALP